MLSDMFRGLAMWVVGHCSEVIDVSSTGAEVRRSADLQKQIFSVGNQKAENEKRNPIENFIVDTLFNSNILCIWFH